MSEKDHETAEERPGTSPPSPTHEATTPPGNGDVDQEAVEKGEDNLGQAGGGH
jgi:hypothetical protein